MVAIDSKMSRVEFYLRKALELWHGVAKSLTAGKCYYVALKKVFISLFLQNAFLKFFV